MVLYIPVNVNLLKMLFQILMLNLLNAGQVPGSGGDPSSKECLPDSGALGDGDQAGPESVPSKNDDGEKRDDVPADPLAPLPEVGGDVPNPEVPGEEDDEGFSEEQKKLGEKLNKKWREQMEEATAPFKTQNITIYEPLSSRSSNHVLATLDRVWARYRSLGIPMLRLHSDRAREIISKPVQKWAARRGLFQTVTAGDDAPANGRIESEILQFKRRLRLTLQSAAAKVEEWPSVARHSSEERLRAQLQRVGSETA
eukprot:s3784_g3.t1